MLFLPSSLATRRIKEKSFLAKSPKQDVKPKASVLPFVTDERIGALWSLIERKTNELRKVNPQRINIAYFNKHNSYKKFFQLSGVQIKDVSPGN